MTDLSPAAKAVLDAVPPHPIHEQALAATLRVAAEQVGNWDAAEHLLSLAAELEAHGQA